MAWFVWLALYIASFFIQRALAPKPDKPQPKGVSDFQFPTAEASRAVPVVFGTCKLTGPNVVWYGDFRADGFQIKGQDAGFYYYLGADLALCHGPVDEVHDVLFEDRSPGWTRTLQAADYDRFRMDNTMLFGGNTQGGGIVGDCDFYYGIAAQTPNDYLQAKANADYPGLSQICHAVMRGIYWGTSEYIKPLAFLVTRCPNTLGMTGNKHRIAFSPPGWGYDSNPACMLYDILTNAVWGLGLPSSSIDVASFQAAGETLYAEGFGLAMVLDQQADATEVIGEILRHVDGDLFTDPQSGLLTLALTRADYDPGTLPVLDETNLDDVELTRGSWSETANVAKITYTSRQDNFTARIAQWQNQANLQIRGQVALTEVEFRGLSNPHAAGLVAGRVLKTVSYPLARLKLTANRTAWALRPGSVFKLNWPPLGISGMVCRVTRPAGGELGSGKITVEAIEDAFSISATAYTDPGGSGWVDPLGQPTAAAAQALVEAPHQLAGDAIRQLVALAARGDSSLLGYQIWSDPAGGTAFGQTGSATGFAALGHLVPTKLMDGPAIDDSEWEIDQALDMDLLGSVSEDEFTGGVNLLVVDDEVMAWRYVTKPDANYRISRLMRGVLDTVPGDHVAGATVWFLPQQLPLVNPSAPYQSDLTVAVKVLPYNLRYVLGLSSATAMSLALASRALKPLPPGKVRVNGTAWPQNVTGDAVITWTHRHRVQQTAAGIVVSQDAEDFAAAPEGDYTIEVRVNLVLKRTVTGITGKTWTYTAAMRAADDPDPLHLVQIRIIPVNGGLSGRYQVRAFLMV